MKDLGCAKKHESKIVNEDAKPSFHSVNKSSEVVYNSYDVIGKQGYKSKDQEKNDKRKDRVQLNVRYPKKF